MVSTRSLATASTFFLFIAFAQSDAIARGGGHGHGSFSHGFFGHGSFDHGSFLGHGLAHSGHHDGHHNGHHDGHDHHFAMHDHRDGHSGHSGHWQPGHWQNAGGFGGHGAWSSHPQGVWGL